jgi:hypothetical protein
MIIGFGDDWKDVLIVWILRDKIAEFWCFGNLPWLLVSSASFQNPKLFQDVRDNVYSEALVLGVQQETILSVSASVY